MKLNQILLADCMDVMREMPDKAFELAIVDPPYGLGERLTNGGSSSPFIISQGDKVKKWDDSTPDAEFFDELFRITKNQIIWGGNYFDLPPHRCFVVWDKTIHGNSYSDAELAWTSFDSPSRIFSQNIASITSEGRIHPTQKSIKLYRWLLKNYAKPGDKILDTHGGSCSSVIACLDMGFEYLAIEKDPDYHAAACKRVAQYQSQTKLFA